VQLIEWNIYICFGKHSHIQVIVRLCSKPKGSIQHIWRYNQLCDCRDSEFILPTYYLIFDLQLIWQCFESFDSFNKLILNHVQLSS
jgi:hypothetical protein